MLCESQLIKTDVTTVKLTDNYILVGIGNFLNVYHQKQNDLIIKVKIFDGHKIHGIELDDLHEDILIHGGCYMNKLACNFETVQLTSSCSKISTDWILAAKWLKNKSIAVIVMLNKLILYDEDLNILRQVVCDEKCILYSAFIHRTQTDGLVIFSGTVFGEILIWRENKILSKLQGHKGVIFSIDYNATSGCICSSSDDRSTILWSVGDELGEDFPKIHMKCKVYGHQSRVFRSMILDRFLITAGEDSYVNVWTFDGKLARKFETHQGGPVWALDSDGGVIATGGGDCGLLLTPLHNNIVQSQAVLPYNEIPKRLSILRSGNLVAITEKGTLFYFLRNKQEWLKIKHHEDLKNYNLLEVSKCRRLFSLAGYHGEIYIYKEGERTVELASAYKIGTQSRIYSFHWLSCDTFLTCESGLLTLWWLINNQIKAVTTFDLLDGKDTWTTAACAAENGRFVVGDRKGNISVYVVHRSKPVQCFKRAHNYLGVTNIHSVDNKIVSLGRNAVVKTFVFDDSQKLIPLCSDKVPFSWLTALVEGSLLAFSGKNIVVWDYETRRTLFEHDCGGGHRSWDFHKMADTMTLAYVKDHQVKLAKYERTKTHPVNSILGYHTKVINSMKILRIRDAYVSFSGSEDTNLRISLIREDTYVPLEHLKSHLSSIRTVCVYGIPGDERRKDYLIFSGGGRGQIVCWKFSIDFGNLENRVFSEHYSYYERPDEALSETRIMDLCTVVLDDQVLLLAATSEGNISVFSVIEENGRYKIHFIKNLFHKLKCVTRLRALQTDQLNILISSTTDGNVTFWDISAIMEAVPFKTVNVHQSGVNSTCAKLIQNDLLLFLTGGDDNKISLNLFQIVKSAETVSIMTVATFQDCQSHCAQITGVSIFDGYFLTTSVDQKLVIFTWKIHKQKLICHFLTKYDSAVADIQGMQCEESDDCFCVFLYGKGVELVKCTKTPSV